MSDWMGQHQVQDAPFFITHQQASTGANHKDSQDDGHIVKEIGVNRAPKGC